MILFRDIRCGLRALLKRPGFTVVAVLALGIGVGATSAMFAIIDRVLYRPLPFPQSEQLVNVWETNFRRHIPQFTVTPANYYDWRAQNKVFSAMGAYQQNTFNLASTEGEPERFVGAIADHGFFATLDVSPMLGRIFREDEEQAGRDGVVILSYKVWRERFGALNNIIGQTLILDGRPRTVLAVMPEGFEYPQQATMWVPLGFDDQTRGRRDLHRLRVIARLGQNTTLERARAEFKTIGSRLAQEYPTSNRDSGVTVHPVLEDMVGDLRPALFILLGAVVFVLLITCANVANLLLVKAVGRQREVAIRRSLGAHRSRIISQMLTESTLLSCFGGVAGLLFAYIIFHGLLSLAPTDLPRLKTITLDWRAASFAIVISIVTGILFGLAPAWYASKTDLNLLLKEGSAGSGSSRSRRLLQNILVVNQVAAAMILLVGAGLLIRSFHKVAHVDPGFKPDNVMTARLAPALSKYRGHDDLLISFAHEIISTVSALPGVKRCAIATDVPLLGNPFVIMQFEGRPPVPPSQAPLANYFAVTPAYAEAMGMQVLRGRFVGEQDSTASPVVVVNQTLVNRYFPGEDPIGKRMAIGFNKEPVWREIIGIVADVKSAGLDQDTPVQIYIPYFQQPTLFGVPSPMTVVAQTEREPGLLSSSIKDAILKVDRSQPVYAVQPMTAIISQSLSEQRFSLILLAFFASAALLLAAMGLYGVMSYVVVQRTGEIGIRMALGAQQGQVWMLVQRQAIILVALGLAIGSSGALLLTRFMNSLLFRVDPSDPLTFAAVTGLLLLVSVVACHLPATRAARLDPSTALRYE